MRVLLLFDPPRPEARSGVIGSVLLTASGFPQIRTLGYCCQLVGGVLVEQCPARSEVGTRLLALSSQLSHCRVVLRLFDDAAMFVYTKQYGLGAEVTGVCGAPGRGCGPWEVGILWTGLYKGNNMGCLLFFQFYFFFETIRRSRFSFS